MRQTRTTKSTKSASAALAFSATETAPTKPKGNGIAMTEAPKPTTLADLLAAVEIGAMDPSTAVVPESAIAERIAREAAIARQAGEDAGRQAAIRGLGDQTGAALPPGMVAVPARVHDCAISGCAHGAVHGPDYRPQPDRQLKLAAPCGARVRMTQTALGRAGGSITCGHGDPFTVDTNVRTYTKR